MSFCYHGECSCIFDRSSISNGEVYIKELKIIANAYMFLDELWGKIVGKQEKKGIEIPKKTGPKASLL